METDLKLRLQAYATKVDAQIASEPFRYADALGSSIAASAAASASIICSHSRILRGDSPPTYLLPGQHELDFLAADKPSGQPASDLSTGQGAPPSAAEHTDPAPPGRTRLPLRPGKDTLKNLALGAAGIPAILDHGA